MLKTKNKHKKMIIHKRTDSQFLKLFSIHSAMISPKKNYSFFYFFSNNTDLIVIFDDGYMIRRHLDNKGIDTFIHNNALGLDLQFRYLYLVGDRGGSFRQYKL